MAHISANSGNGSQLPLMYASTLHYISLKLSDLLIVRFVIVWILIPKNYELPHAVFIQQITALTCSHQQSEQLAVYYPNSPKSTCPCLL